MKFLTKGALRSALFCPGARRDEPWTALETIAWIDGNVLNLVFGAHLPTARKERLAPISLLAHVEKSPAILIDEPPSKWPNDIYLSQGNHPWSLILPVFLRDNSGVSLRKGRPLHWDAVPGVSYANCIYSSRTVTTFWVMCPSHRLPPFYIAKAEID